MISEKLEKLCEIATESNKRIQADFEALNPMMGINQKMRDMGVPADVVTIDCLKSGRRILLILHDHEPDIVHYQFSFKDRDPDDAFARIALSDLTVDTMYDWIRDYFQAAAV